MVVKVKSKYLDAYYSDVARMLAELDKLKKTPGDAKAKARIDQIKKALADSEVEKLMQKAMILDANDLKKQLKSMF